MEGGLHRDGLVWLPAGVLVVANDPRVQRARNAQFQERRKLVQRKIRIGFKPNPKCFPEPKTTAYSYRQYAYAQQMGLIEERPRPQPAAPQFTAMRRSGGPKRIPPRRTR